MKLAAQRLREGVNLSGLAAAWVLTMLATAALVIGDAPESLVALVLGGLGAAVVLLVVQHPLRLPATERAAAATTEPEPTSPPRTTEIRRFEAAAIEIPMYGANEKLVTVELGGFGRSAQAVQRCMRSERAALERSMKATAGRGDR